MVIQYWKPKQQEIDEEILQMTQNAIVDVETSETSRPLSFDQKTRLPISLTTWTAINWLHWLCYNYQDIKKGIYKDGHDRKDIVEYQQSIFLPTLATLQSSFKEWVLDDNRVFTITCPEFDGRLQVAVTYDECTFNANDCQHQHWTEKDEMPLKSKSREKSIMISNFLTMTAWLQVPPAISEDKLPSGGWFATELLECGGHIWWKCNDLIKQVIEHAIPIFEVAHPGCQAVFFLDNATGHAAFAFNTLWASKMNISPCRKQPRIWDGYFYS